MWSSVRLPREANRRRLEAVPRANEDVDEEKGAHELEKNIIHLELERF